MSGIHLFGLLVVESLLANQTQSGLIGTLNKTKINPQLQHSAISLGITWDVAICATAETWSSSFRSVN